MENREIARMLWETADLMEIAGEDGFRIRSYRNAASAIEGYPEAYLGNPQGSREESHRYPRNRQGNRVGAGGNRAAGQLRAP